MAELKKKPHDTECEPTYHYCWIKNLSRLVNNQLSSVHQKHWLCERCLSYFHKKKKFDEHLIDCTKVSPAKYVMPSYDNKWMHFKNYLNKELLPFVIYADLECLTVPIQNCTPDDSCSFTNAYQRHKPCSISYFLKCSYDDRLSKLELYTGEDCIKWFIEKLNVITEETSNIYKNPVAMFPLTIPEQIIFENSSRCHICNREFMEPSEYALDFEEEDLLTKVRDHDHLTGVFRGAAHISCNLNYKIPSYIPVIFHNLSGYDAHFIIKELCEKRTVTENNAVVIDNPGRTTLLPINKEKYKSFSKYNNKNKIILRFIDSFNFLPHSLDSLSSLLDVYDNTKQNYNNLNDAQFCLLKKKGVLPYSYLDSFNKFSETTLPDPEHFFNDLTQTDIKESDYLHAKNIWKQFECKNLGDYIDLYLKTDVLLLADIFEQFRKTCKINYALDPTHYITAPGLAWDAMLKLTDVRLELLTDINMHLFIEKGIRGGISQCSNRYAFANNRYTSQYDPSKPETYLMYFDVVNLYGWTMTQSLPTGHFKWLDNLEIDSLHIETIEDNSDKGYILEVDLKYSPELHDIHAALPFCPEHMAPPGAKFKKLLTTLDDKEAYVIHYRNLKQCLSHGLKITHVHRVLEFDQSPWMKPYVDLNANLRANATNDLDKGFFKLMVNACFGKSMQNVRKMRDVKLATRWLGRAGAGRLIGKPNFKDLLIFDENTAAIELNRLKITFDKPIYVGMAILDISKTLYYKFHYDFMLTKYKHENVQLQYGDTDSYVYLIQTDDVYKDLKPDLATWFDTSDYAENNQFDYPRLNRKKIGYVKDELHGDIMTEFVGLRSKMYAFKTEQGSVTCKSKGTQKSVIKKLTVDDYKQCLQNTGHVIFKKQHRIVSKCHNVYTVEQNKIVLSGYDDKRVVLQNGIETLPYGHYSLGTK